MKSKGKAPMPQPAGRNPSGTIEPEEGAEILISTDGVNEAMRECAVASVMARAGWRYDAADNVFRRGAERIGYDNAQEVFQLAEAHLIGRHLTVLPVWDCGHQHPTRGEAIECKHRQAAAFC